MLSYEVYATLSTELEQGMWRVSVEPRAKDGKRMRVVSLAMPS